MEARTQLANPSDGPGISPNPNETIFHSGVNALKVSTRIIIVLPLILTKPFSLGSIF
jgi:hypothetical protein